MRLDSKQMTQKSSHEFSVGRWEKMLMRSALQFDRERLHRDRLNGRRTSGNISTLAPRRRSFIRLRRTQDAQPSSIRRR